MKHEVWKLLLKSYNREEVASARLKNVTEDGI